MAVEQSASTITDHFSLKVDESDVQIKLQQPLGHLHSLYCHVYHSDSHHEPASMMMMMMMMMCLMQETA